MLLGYRYSARGDLWNPIRIWEERESISTHVNILEAREISQQRGYRQQTSQDSILVSICSLEHGRESIRCCAHHFLSRGLQYQLFVYWLRFSRTHRRSFSCTSRTHRWKRTKYGESTFLPYAFGFAIIALAQLILVMCRKGGCHRTVSGWRPIELAVVNDGVGGAKPINHQEHTIARHVKGTIV